jgi:hypothetical protein
MSRITVVGHGSNQNLIAGLYLPAVTTVFPDHNRLWRSCIQLNGDLGSHFNHLPGWDVKKSVASLAVRVSPTNNRSCQSGMLRVRRRLVRTPRWEKRR